MSNSKEILITNMLSSLVNQKHHVTFFMMAAIPDMKCQLRHLHLGQFFIFQKP